jgi:hypothetical protein
MIEQAPVKLLLTPRQAAAALQLSECHRAPQTIASCAANEPIL